MLVGRYTLKIIKKTHDIEGLGSNRNLIGLCILYTMNFTIYFIWCARYENNTFKIFIIIVKNY